MAEQLIRPIVRFADFSLRPVRREERRLIEELQYRADAETAGHALVHERLQLDENFFAQLGENEHLWVAESLPREEASTKILGYGRLSIDRKPRWRHGGDLMLMVDPYTAPPELEKKLLAKLLDLADNWLMLVRVQVEVFSTDSDSLQLYKSSDFVCEGTKRYAVVQQGRYCDLQILARYRL